MSLYTPLPARPVCSRLRHNPAGSPSSPAESSSLYCGPPIRLRLLPTPPHSDAVTFSYGALAYPDTDLHRAVYAPSRAHWIPGRARDDSREVTRGTTTARQPPSGQCPRPTIVIAAPDQVRGFSTRNPQRRRTTVVIAAPDQVRGFSSAQSMATGVAGSGSGSGAGAGTDAAGKSEQ